MNVLLVEDDRRIAHVLERGLIEDGHLVHLCPRGDEGADLIRTAHFDVVVLDIMLPGLDGFHVIKKVRSSKCSVPILLLTAKDSIPDIVKGLDLGADDYLTKPFMLEVLLARIRAVGRRGQIPQSVELRIGDCSLNRSSKTAYRKSQPIMLTKREFILLELLMRRAGHVVSRNQLIEAGWGYDAEISENSLEYYIHSLRSKFDEPNSKSMIRTVRGFGYSIPSTQGNAD